MSEMIDLAARAIRFLLADRVGVHCWHDDGSCEFDGYLDPHELARAVIEAMREPTVEMAFAGLLASGCPQPYMPDGGMMVVAFRAMIDEALK